MAEVVHPTSISISGPWLLDKATLESLDGLLDELWKKLVSRRNKNLKNAIRTAVRELEAEQ